MNEGRLVRLEPWQSRGEYAESGAAAGVRRTAGETVQNRYDPPFAASAGASRW